MLKSSDIPSSDASVYDRLALAISQGRGYVNTDGTPHITYLPFYPLVVSIVYKFFGHSYVYVRIMQSLIGAFSVVLIYLIGKKMFSNTSGLIAAFISTFYLPFIKSAGLLLTELAFTFLMLLIVFYSLKVQEGGGFRNCIILGFLLGISLLTKSIMLFFLFFIIPIFIYSRDKYFLLAVKKYMVVLLFFTLSLVPWIIRNYNIYHKFIPTSLAAGLGFYSSYCPAKGIFGLDAASDDPIVIEGSKISSPVLRNNFFLKKTIDFIIRNPKKVFVLEFKKILYLWAPFDWEIVGGKWFNFMYVAVLPLFILGFSLAVKEFWKNYPILLAIIYFQIMTLVFYGSPRFRLPIEPYIFILAATGILHCWRWMFVRGE